MAEINNRKNVMGVMGSETIGTTTPFLEESVHNHNDKEDKRGIVEKLQDPNYRRPFVISLWLAFSTFVTGLMAGQQGTSFLDLLIITDTDIKTGASFFTACSFGAMFGSFVSGVLHGKLNNHLLMVLTCVPAGVTSVLIPYCSHYWAMIAARFINCSFCGCIDNVANAEHLRLWRSEGRALLQFIHFTFAVGGMLSPLYTEPFLAVKEQHQNFSSRSVNTSSAHHLFTPGSPNTSPVYEIMLRSNSSLAHDMVVNSSSLHFPSVNSSGVVVYSDTQIHYAYLITGIFCFIAAAPFLVLYVTNRSKADDDNNDTDDDEGSSSSRSLSTSLTVFITFTLCVFYLIYCCIEETFASFLMTFSVQEFSQVSKSRGAYITTAYWASFATGRFISIFVTRYLKPLQLMFLCTSLMITAYSAFLVSAWAGSVELLTVFACLAGIGMSALFPAGLSWAEAEVIRVTARISSTIMVASSAGVMIGPVVIGYLMEEVDNMWFCYIMLGETIVMAGVFIFLLTFNRCYVNVKYGHMKQGAGD